MNSTARHRSRRIGFLLFNGVTALDVAGPMEAFASAQIKDSRGVLRPCYDLITVGLNEEEIIAESGLALKPLTTIEQSPRLDTLVIPGGRGLRETETNTAVSDWIRSRVRTTRRIVTVCTGIFGLAPTGLIDGRNVTTHWRFANDLSQLFPALHVDANALFLKDGQFYTSAGITAGIDLCIALIEEDFGRIVALRVARELVMYMKRSGGQEQYSEPLRFQVASTDGTEAIATYIQAHLSRDLSVSFLAGVACLSERQFSRRFKAAFKTSPAAFVEAIRLDEARTRLCETRCTIDQLAASVGFGSDDSFRRAFEKRFGVSPSHYRNRFGAQKP